MKATDDLKKDLDQMVNKYDLSELVVLMIPNDKSDVILIAAKEVSTENCLLMLRKILDANPVRN